MSDCLAAWLSQKAASVAWVTMARDMVAKTSSKILVVKSTTMGGNVLESERLGFSMVQDSDVSASAWEAFRHPARETLSITLDEPAKGRWRRRTFGRKYDSISPRHLLLL